MNIRVWDDKYLIKSDVNQYILCLNDEKGNSPAIGYYTTMGNLFRSIAEREGRSNKCTTFEGYVRHMEKIEKQLAEDIEIISEILGGKEILERVFDTFVSKVPPEIHAIDDSEPPEKTENKIRKPRKKKEDK